MLIFPPRAYIVGGGLVPNYGLAYPRAGSRSQGFGCSPIKVLRELGLPDLPDYSQGGRENSLVSIFRGRKPPVYKIWYDLVEEI